MRLSIAVCFLAVAGLASAETHQVVPDRFYNTFSHTNPVFLRINQGDVVITKTLDSGGIDEHGEARASGGNPLTGPFYIDNAEPGDAILVHLRKVRLNRN
jgi:acetamidase/formamidase